MGMADSRESTDPSLAWSVSSTVAVIALLSIVQVKVERTMLLAERFVPGAGWVELIALGIYAGIITHLMADPRRTARIRRRIWGLFSVVFFAQLILGMAGIERCLMTGGLHLPVPAMILAGPLFRGHPSFMIYLLVATLLLVGPAWCSHLCYFGAWDSAFSRVRKRPVALPRWRRWCQLGVLVLVVGVALGLNVAGVPGTTATALGLGFGVLGVVVMATLSRHSGAMVHCVVYCPIGLVTAILGRVSPFRVRIAQSCDACGACRTACRYDALSPGDIQRRRPALSCTLCGDCLRTCPGNSLHYTFPFLSPADARMFFITAVVTLHAATMAMGMI